MRWERQVSDERESTADTRREMRADIRAPATYVRSSVTDPFAGVGTATEFSRFGVRIEHASDEVKPGDQLELQFSLFPDSYATVFPGRVVWEKGDSFGIEFVGLKPHHLRVLQLAMRRP